MNLSGFDAKCPEKAGQTHPDGHARAHRKPDIVRCPVSVRLAPSVSGLASAQKVSIHGPSVCVVAGGWCDDRSQCTPHCLNLDRALGVQRATSALHLAPARAFAGGNR